MVGVENILARVLCPLQIGFTKAKDLDVSLKCCVKQHPEDDVPIIAKLDGKFVVKEQAEIRSRKSLLNDSNALSKFDLEKL